MITLDIHNDPTKPRLCMVGCLHGNETLGLKLFEAISSVAPSFDNLLVIIANLPAYHANTRFLDQDLNRSFPGNATGNTEERLAHQISQLIKGADMLIDVHATTSPDFPAAAITGPLTDAKRRVIAAFGLKYVAIMEPTVLKTALIGNTKEGVSVEYGLEIAKRPTLIPAMVKALQSLQTNAKLSDAKVRKTTVYDVISTIPKTETSQLQNFVYSKSLQGYPFIVDEKHYRDTRGFLLGKPRTESMLPVHP